MTTEQKIEALGKAYSVLAADCEQWKARAAEVAEQLQEMTMAAESYEALYSAADQKLAIAVEALEKIQAECDDESFLEWQMAAEALAKIKGEE